MAHILITGGAGFVGTNLALHLKDSGQQVTAFDNLKRRGSEINLRKLANSGVAFVHGDVRQFEDLPGDFDILIECSAEPSVLGGLTDPSYMIDTNLYGAINCIRKCLKENAALLFLSTSRVYPYDKINELNYGVEGDRFVLTQSGKGYSPSGFTEDFSLSGPRSLYGATKLSAELLIQEFVQDAGLQAVINRCGVIAGPHQMGKVDQGVFTFWLASHYWTRSIKYIGFGGLGHQVRDVLHIKDLCELIQLQIDKLPAVIGETFNVGGGLNSSLSLLETTHICEELTGNKLTIDSEMQNRPMDVPFYVTDNTHIKEKLGWEPRRTAKDVLTDIYEWIKSDEKTLGNIL